jgi:hypothetical protein
VLKIIKKNNKKLNEKLKKERKNKQSILEAASGASTLAVFQRKFD